MMEPTREQLVILAEQLAETAAEEIDCEAVLSCVSAYLEIAEASKTLPPELDAVAQHLKVCPECLEEYQALVRALAPE